MRSINALNRGCRIGLHVGMSEASLENAVLDRRRFFEIKSLNYVRARSAYNIIPIL